MSAASVFSEYARYYDLLYKDKDYAGEAAYVHRLIERYLPQAHTLLELGSGTGKHAAFLSDHGYAVHGIERSNEMLNTAGNMAAERRIQFPSRSIPSFSLGDIRCVRLGRTFDTVISLFHVIIHDDISFAAC